MTLRSVRVERFRSISDSGEPAIGPIKVVTGRNHSRKSALLRAVYLIQEGAPFRADDNRLRAAGTATVTA